MFACNPYLGIPREHFIEDLINKITTIGPWFKFVHRCPVAGFQILGTVPRKKKRTGKGRFSDGSSGRGVGPLP